jgi:hypothetical protein
LKKLVIPLRFTSKFQKNPAKKNILPRFHAEKKFPGEEFGNFVAI